MKILQRFAVRGIGREGFQPLEVKQCAVHLIRAGLGDHIDDSAGGASELSAGAACDHLKFLDRIERDIDSSTLAAYLLAKETVVVVAAVKADVVEDAALAG